MLDFETHIERHAEYTRERSTKIASYRAASWLNHVDKLSLFTAAYPVAAWPLLEVAIISSLLTGIVVLALSIF